MTDAPIRHAFLSYVHEDSEAVDEIEAHLDAAGIDVWRDTKDLWPGQDWQARIRAAIRDGSLAFIACVSTTSVHKAKTFQNEELTLAVDELRLRQPGAQWLFVVRLDECEVPEFDLGGGRTLRNLHYTDYFGPKKTVNLTRLVTSVRGLLEPAASPAQVAALISAGSSKSENSLEDAIKVLLRDPHGDIQLEERVDEATDRALEELADQSRFPTGPAAFGADNVTAVRLADEITSRYEEVLRQLTSVFVLAGTYGQPSHAHVWTRAMDAVASAYEPGGAAIVAGLREYPLVWLMQAVAVASVERGNFEALRAVAVDAILQTGASSGPVVGFVSVGTPFRDLPWVGSALAIHQDSGRAIDEELITALQRRTLGGRHTPISDLIHARLRPYFARLIRQDDRYEAAYDRASVLLDALAMDVRLQRGTGGAYIPASPGFGRYTWRGANSWPQVLMELVMKDDLHLRAEVARAGLFGGSEERYDAAFAQLAEWVEKVRHQRQFA